MTLCPEADRESKMITHKLRVSGAQTPFLFAAGDLLAHIVHDTDVVARGRLPYGAGLHPLVHLLEGPAQQRGLCLAVALYEKKQKKHGG